MEQSIVKVDLDECEIKMTYIVLSKSINVGVKSKEEPDDMAINGLTMEQNKKIKELFFQIFYLKTFWTFFVIEHVGK